MQPSVGPEPSTCYFVGSVLTSGGFTIFMIALLLLQSAIAKQSLSSVDAPKKQMRQEVEMTKAFGALDDPDMFDNVRKACSFRMLRVTGLITSTVVGYLAPGTFGAAFYVLLHTSAVLNYVIAGSVFAVLLVLIAYLFHTVAINFNCYAARHPNKHDVFVNLDVQGTYVESYLGFIGPVRDEKVPLQRIVYFEDVLNAALLSMTANLRPTDTRFCILVLGIMFGLALIHLLYLLLTRPYFGRLDTIFSLLLASLQMVLATFCIIALYYDSAWSGSTSLWCCRMLSFCAARRLLSPHSRRNI